MTKDTIQEIRDFMNEGFEAVENFEAQHKQRFEVLKHLWKVGDDAWMRQRKDEWRELAKTSFNDSDAKDRKAYGKFFLTGEEMQGIYMSALIKFILTPFSSPEYALKLYELVTHPQDKSSVLGGFLNNVCSYATGMPWLRNHVLNFIEGVLGSEYKIIKASNGRHEKIISPDPTSFCGDYAKYALKLIRKEQDYNYSVDSVPYFISALPYVDRPKFRKFIKLQEMMDEVDLIMITPDEHPKLVQDLARQLKERKEEIWSNWKVNEHLDQPK